MSEQNLEQNKSFLLVRPAGRISYFTSRTYSSLIEIPWGKKKTGLRSGEHDLQLFPSPSQQIYDLMISFAFPVGKKARPCEKTEAKKIGLDEENVQGGNVEGAARRR